MVITQILASLFLMTSPTNCDREIEVYGTMDGNSWEVSSCIDNGSDNLKESLRRFPEEILFDIEWCVVEEDWVFCDEVTRDSAHPWCDSIPYPQICDGVCCLWTIIDCGCGGCISGTTAYCV